MNILLDLDGVCVDFVGAACRLHGRTFDETVWPPGEYDIAEVLGIGDEEFWEVIHRQGVDFWRGLEAYPWFVRLHRELQRRGRVYFVTSPSRSPHSAAGKMLWLKERFGETFKDFVLTRRKHLLSRADCVLIDDSDRNVREFERHGSGSGVLFPQRWNSGHGQAGVDRVGHVLKVIERIESGRTL